MRSLLRMICRKLKDCDRFLCSTRRQACTATPAAITTSRSPVSSRLRHIHQRAYLFRPWRVSGFLLDGLGGYGMMYIEQMKRTWIDIAISHGRSAMGRMGPLPGRGIPAKAWRLIRTQSATQTQFGRAYAPNKANWPGWAGQLSVASSQLSVR